MSDNDGTNGTNGTDGTVPEDVTPQRPRPRPHPEPTGASAAEPEQPTQTDEPDKPTQTDQTDQTDQPKAPESAASRARRIGGRPVVADSAPDLDKREKRPAPAPSAAARPATPPAAKEPKPPKAPKEPKPPKAARPAKEPAAAGQGAALRWAPTSVLTAVAVILIVLIAIAAHGVYYAKKAGPSSTGSDPAQQQALAAAKTCIAAINTYDYRKLDQAEASALACTTGAFTTSLRTTFEKTIKPQAPAAQATQTAQVNQAGIQAVSPDGKQIQILMYGQLTITNVQTPSGSPRYDPFGIVVTMDKVGQTWLVAKYGSDVGATVGN